LLAVAAKTIGDRCLGVIADNPSLPRQALADALQLARQIKAAAAVAAVALLAAPDGIGYEEVELDPQAIARHPRSGKFT
jgi:PP-loop superfamily ATP-utilizing enzyme